MPNTFPHDSADSVPGQERPCCGGEAGTSAAAGECLQEVIDANLVLEKPRTEALRAWPLAVGHPPVHVVARVTCRGRLVAASPPPCQRAGVGAMVKYWTDWSKAFLTRVAAGIFNNPSDQTARCQLQPVDQQSLESRAYKHAAQL
jgi:hypothetical protein